MITKGVNDEDKETQVKMRSEEGSGVELEE